MTHSNSPETLAPPNNTVLTYGRDSACCALSLADTAQDKERLREFCRLKRREGATSLTAIIRRQSHCGL